MILYFIAFIVLATVRPSLTSTLRGRAPIVNVDDTTDDYVDDIMRYLNPEDDIDPFVAMDKIDEIMDNLSEKYLETTKTFDGTRWQPRSKVTLIMSIFETIGLMKTALG